MKTTWQRPPGCACDAKNKRGDKCDARWIRCNERIAFERAKKIEQAKAPLKADDGRVVRYLVKIDGMWWHEFSTTYGGYWTKHRRLATRFTRSKAKIYKRYWKAHNVSIVPVST